ncbi:hypothetical protein KY326_03735 [Candidatus Woesearchaeota archaeon]|nr:hypothetical protein [Candidatus Woesearchaeota archaeon]
MTKIKDKTKEELINMIIEDFKANEYDSLDALYDLAEECLQGKTREQIIQEV